MFYHRTGYKPQAENVATHARRRYRLVATTQMGMNNPDPSLWLIHYSKAAPENRLPVAQLPVAPHTAQIFQARQLIQRSGPLPRKEFLLHDRSQWPMIALPTGISKPGAGQLVGGHRRGGSIDQQAMIEEEEDVSRGDVLDFITPREISRMRYEQHHEWMEEILESPYATKQIVPSELGLGKKGTMEVFTNGFFTAPMSHSQDPLTGPVGKLGSVKADEFTKHADSKLAEMQADLEKMKQQHIRRMEKLKRTTDLGMAERKVRNMNPADDSYKTVAAHVQNMMGRKIDIVHRVHQVSKGGQQDIKPIVRQPQYTAPQNAYQMQQQQQMQLQAQSQAQVNQQQQQQQRSQPQPSQQTPSIPQQAQQPQPQNTPQTQIPSTIAQPSAQPQNQQVTTQPQPSSSTTQQQVQQQTSQTQPQPQTETSSTQSAQQSVAVPAKEPVEPTDTQSTHDSGNAQMQNNDALDGGDMNVDDYGDVDNGNADGDDWDMLVDQSGGADDQNVDDQGDAEPDALQADMPDTTSPPQQDQNTHNLTGETNDFDMVTDFDANMDTAGDALADYGADDDLNLDDSAFGDAFHHNQQDMS